MKELSIEDFRALKIKGGSTLIIKKENFDLLLNAVKRFGEDEGEEVQVTQEMLDNAQFLLPPSIKIPEVPDFNYIK